MTEPPALRDRAATGPHGEPLRPPERAAHRLYAHVCWTTLGRLPLLRPPLQAALEGHLIALCRRLDAEPIAVTALGDRVHLLLRHKPTHALARLVPALKRGGREALERAGESVAWGRGFAAASVGGREVKRVVRSLAALADREEAAVAGSGAASRPDRVGTPARDPDLARRRVSPRR